MLCENCGKHEANVKYTQIINGQKIKMNLCEACSEKLGISNMELKMPINFSSFLGDFFDEFEKDAFLSQIKPVQELKCERCGQSFKDFMNTGKFGCSNCYNAFESKIDPILKNIHGSSTHVGRLGEISELKNEIQNENKESKNREKQDNENIVKTPEVQELRKEEKLKEELKKAIKEERYEDAAKLRDEIKKLEK